MKKCIITIYYLIDNFCKIYQQWEQNKLLPSNKIRQRQGNLTLAELMTIVVRTSARLMKLDKNRDIMGV